jgi:NAD(P)-dependent dehydrogenase (short-subunit alcohol dehydrogenase family)
MLDATGASHRAPAGTTASRIRAVPGGKAILVTGAAGGLGASTVAALVDGGHRVLAVDLEPDAVDALASRLGDAVAPHAADVSDGAQVAAAVRAAVERFGRLDGVFSNAGIEGAVADVVEYPEEEYDRVMRVNARSVWLGMKHAIPALLAAGGGSIVNTSSTGGMMGWPQLSPYVASKHAVVGMTRAVALEYAGRGIRANVLAPGPMDTRMIWAIGDAMAPGDRGEQRRLLEATVPVGRLGRPEEVAALAVWLLTACPEYLTGAVLPVDGAQSAG